MSTSPIKHAADSIDKPKLAVSSSASEPASSDKGWLKATLPVAFIAAFAELGLSVINNEFQIYVPKGLGLGPIIMAAVMVPFFVSEVVFKSPLGVLADRWGRKPLMVLGPAISIFTPLVLASIAYPSHHVVLPLLVAFGFLRLLDGLGAASLWPAMYAYIGDHVSERKRTSAMSVLNVTYIIGMALGFLAGGWANDTFGPVLAGQSTFRNAMGGVYSSMQNNLAQKVARLNQLHSPNGQILSGRAKQNLESIVRHAQDHSLQIGINQPIHYHPSFYLGSILFALATCIAVLMLKDKKQDKIEGVEHHTVAAEPSEKMTWKEFVGAVKCVPHLMLIALITFTGMGCIMLLPKYFALDELGVSETQFGLLVLWPAVLIGAIAVPLGHVSDKVGSTLSIKVGFCIGAIGMWILVLLYGSPKTMDIGLLCGASLLGVGFVLAFPAWMALLTTMGHQSHRGTIVGAVSTAQGVGAAIGIGIGSWLYAHGGSVWGHIGVLLGRNFNSSSHISHIAPFAVSGMFLAVSAILTIIMIKPVPSSQSQTA